MISTLLFDIDGVIIQYEKQFTETLDDSIYKNPVDVISEFYNGQINVECDKGYKDPVKEIELFTKKIGWAGSSEEYLIHQYTFESQYIDYELLHNIKLFRKKGFKCYIASNQNNFRKAFLKKVMKAEEVFDNSFFSCDFGFVKPERKYWECIYQKLLKDNPKLEKSDILFLDDSFKNIESAADFGITAQQVDSKEKINKVLSLYDFIV